MSNFIFWSIIVAITTAFVFVVCRSIKVLYEKRQVNLYNENNVHRIQDVVNQIAKCDTFDEVIELRGEGFDVTNAMYEDIKKLCPSDPLYVFETKQGYIKMILQAARLKFEQFQRFNELKSLYWQYLN